MIISILGCGWLGFELGRQLKNDKEYTVKGSTTSSGKLQDLNNNGIIPFLLDLEKEVPTDFFPCDVLVITVPPSSGNYEAKLKKTVEHIKKAGIEKVLFTSTTSVYPNINGDVTEKDADYLPSPHSGMVMLAMEDILRNETEFRTTCLRFAGLYGPDRHPGRFLAGKKKLKGAQNPVNLIHRDDCIAIINEIIEQDCWGESFNACSDKHPLRQVFYTYAARSVGLPEPEFTTEPAPFKIIRSEKLKSALHYNFHHPDPMDDL